LIAPPKYALKFLRWFCREDYIEEVEGNLVEVFERDCNKESLARARKKFTWNVIKHFRPAFIRSFKSRIGNNITDMLKHNLLISLRNYMKYKSTFLINIAGLSTGLATVFFVYLWVNDEWSKNRFNPNDDRLYQVFQTRKETDGHISTGGGTPGLLAEALASELPEVETAVSVVPSYWFNSTCLVTYNDKKIKVPEQYASKDFYKVFAPDVIRGDAQTALSKKSNILVSEDLANRLFGNVDEALGKTIEVREWKSKMYEVTGVFRQQATDTDPYDILMNYDNFLDEKPWLKEWGNSDPRTFVVLKNGVDAREAADKIHDFLKKKIKDTDKSLMIQRYSDTYLYNRYEEGKAVGGRIEYVRLFIAIAAVILIIACINFMNLSTARATRRLKEVGVKKAIGAKRGSLAMQFLTESIGLACAAAIIALSMVWMLLPAFNTITGKHIALKGDPTLVVLALIVVGVTGFVSGSYPALYLSRFKAGEVLKGKIRKSFGELIARKGLVVFQYAISFILIVGVIIIYKQIDYVQSMDLGYDREHIIHFDLEVEASDDPNYFAPGGTFEQGVETIMNETRRIPGVVSVANFYHDVTGYHGGLGGVDWEPGDKDVQTSFNNLEVGYDFLPTLGVEMAQGRNYSRRYTGETSKIIFNETAIKLMGLKDPVGQTIKLWGEDRQIIGVVKDFHYESLYQELKPVLIQLVPPAPRIMVKLDGEHMSETIAAVRQLYERHYPGIAFEYAFVDDDYNALYASEQKVSVLSRIFAGLAIVISCLGLYGLTAFTAERRMKEISVRKVFGASEISIMRLLSSEFTVLVLVAMLVGVPMVWLAGRSWLSGFAYRSDISWWYFLAGAGSIFFITLITVSVNTVRAARANPAETLRNE
jgi:putative ABC transport system permease protein